MKKIPSIIIAIFVLICILYSLSVSLYFFWTLWWFDIVLHILGGMWVALIALWYTRVRVLSSEKKAFAVALIASFGIGVLWEVFEYVTGTTFAHDNYIFDTLSDLAADIAGGGIAFIYARKKWIVHNQ